ncbi:MAG: AMP-binding protein, partial [Gammaproteobacteria bacterium]
MPAGTDPYAKRIWLKAYPQGVPADIGIRRYSSLVDQFEQCFTRYGTRPAFANMGGVLTYSTLDELSRAFAAFLQDPFGLKPGARIAIMLPNLLQFPVALIGALRAGLIVVNTNPLYTPRELHHQLVDSGASAIVILSNCAHVLEKALPGSRVENVIITDLGDLLPWPRRAIINFVVRRIKRLVPKHEIRGAFGFREALDIGKGLKLDRVSIGHADLAMLQYTGGTTAVPKA